VISSTTQVAEAEREIRKTLHGRILPPTAWTFVDLFCDLYQEAGGSLLKPKAKEILLETLHNYNLKRHLPGDLAAGALIVAKERYGPSYSGTDFFRSLARHHASLGTTRRMQTLIEGVAEEIKNVLQNVEQG